LTWETFTHKAGVKALAELLKDFADKKG